MQSPVFNLFIGHILKFSVFASHRDNTALIKVKLVGYVGGINFTNSENI